MKHKFFLEAIVGVLILCLVGCTGNKAEQQSAAKENKTLIEKAYAIGNQITTSKKSDSDKKSHKVKYRAEKIITDKNETNKLVKKFNSSGAGKTISEDPGEDMSYIVMKYKVKYPASFPAKEYGIKKPSLKFTIRNREGEKTIEYKGKQYDGLGETFEIGSQPAGYDFYPGDTYHGKVIYILPKGCNEYLIKEGRNYIDPKKK